MGVHYSNITLRGVSQNELVAHLSDVRLDAYVTPTINEYTVLYDLASIGYPYEIPKLIQLESNLEALLDQYLDARGNVLQLLIALFTPITQTHAD